MILFTGSDPARYWQTQAYGGHEELFEFPCDVYLYSVDRGAKGGMRNKGDTYIVTADPNIKASRSIKVARLQFAGNWNPEPGSWRRLGAILHNTEKTELDVQNINLGDSKLDKSFQIADLTGTFKFALTDAQREEIKQYVKGGGTLIVDSAGGDAAFAESAASELAAIFPDGKLDPTPLPLSDPVFRGGPKLEEVEYREFAQKLIGKMRAPRIRTMQISGRPAVFFSGEDLACGMLGMQIDGVNGYDPASATALMEKIVLSVAPAQVWAVPQSPLPPSPNPVFPRRNPATTPPQVVAPQGGPALPQGGPVAGPGDRVQAPMPLPQDMAQIQQLQQKIIAVMQSTMAPQAKQKAIQEIQQQIIDIMRNQQQNPPAPAPVPAPAPAPAPVPVPAPPPEIPAPTKSELAAAALAAAQKLKADKHDELAYPRFKEIVSLYPGTPEAAAAAQEVAAYENDSALMQKISAAAAAAKAKAALELANSYRADGRNDLAKQKYQEIVDQFPGTESAQKAQKRLNKMTPKTNGGSGPN